MIAHTASYRTPWLLAVAIAFLWQPSFCLADAPEAAADETPEEAKATPENAALLYFKDLKAGDYKSMTGRMHPDALIEFKKIMLAIAMAAEEDGAFDELAVLFADADIETVEQLREVDPNAFFLAFFRSVVKFAPQIQAIFKESEAEMVGHVMEKEIAHVIARLEVTVDKAKITKMIVISMKPTADGWGVLLSAEFDGVVQSLKRRFL